MFVNRLNIKDSTFAEYACTIGDMDGPLEDLIDAVVKGNDHFGVPINPVLYMPQVQKHIIAMTRYRFTWKSLTNRPDYNMIRMLSRNWPYFHIDADEAKEWKRASTGVRDQGYPIGAIIEKDEPDADMPYTNFLAYEAVPPNKYANVEILVKHLTALHDHTSVEEMAIRLAINPDTCHIIKQDGFRKLISENSEGHRMYRYALYYAMYILRHEETVLFSKITKNHRSVFTHAEALRIFSNGSIITSPFIQQLTSTVHMTMTMPFYVHGKRKLTTGTVFSRRFYLATGGCLEGINLASLNAAVSGSILIPCVATNPLEANYSEDYWGIIPAQFQRWEKEDLTDEDKSFMLYLEYLYPSYDSLLPKALAKELNVGNSTRDFESDEKSDSYKSRGYNTVSDIDISISVSSGVEFTDIVNKLFAGIKRNCPDAVLIRKETLSSFKFKIIGSSMIRPIDVFQIYYPPVRMTKKFHMECVKMWFEGTADQHFDGESIEGLYIHRSALACLLSGVNERYSWYSCNKIPAEVAMKYVMRGYTIILNQSEINSLIQFMKATDRWGWVIDIIGCVSHKHAVFADDIHGTRFGLVPFPLTHKTMSDPIPINFNPPQTRYGVDLKVKNGVRVFAPRDEVIKSYIEWQHMNVADNSLNHDEFKQNLTPKPKPKTKPTPKTNHQLKRWCH